MRSVRQLIKEAKSSFGSAVRTLLGNVLIKLLMMLEMPTASESSISILRVKMEIVRNRGTAHPIPTKE